VTIVMIICSRMIRVNPMMPASTIRPATTTSAISLVEVPPCQPSRVSTLDVASTASAVSTVSQPTVSSQDSTEGSRLPLIPKIARLSTMVGAEPRLPASEITPQSRNDSTIPTQPTSTACQNEMPKPSRNEP